MTLTYFGHSCFAVEVNGKKLVFDPFITPNELAKNINLDDIEADYILVTHGHQDHIADAVQLAQNTGATVISNFEIISWFNTQGVDGGHPMNHGGAFDFDFGRVKYVNAIHSSSFPDGSYAGNPGGFIIMSKEKNFYFAGDTALTMDMQLIPHFAKLDLAILPIGDNFTMGPDDAIMASDFIKCNRILGAHYDTFGYIRIDHEAVKKKFSDAGKELILLEIGESMNF